MTVALDPDFLTGWVQAELEAEGEPSALAARAAMDAELGLDEDEARAEAAGALAEKRGLQARMEEAAASLGAVQVREARGAAERLERTEPKLFAGPPACVAWLRAAPGAAGRLAALAEKLLAQPGVLFVEIEGPLGGSPGCSVR